MPDSVEDQGKLNRFDPGRLGGKTTLERYGLEHFREIGRKGGRALRDRFGPEHFSELGKKGGAARVARLPKEQWPQPTRKVRSKIAAHKLRELRRAAGLTQMRLAAKIGKPQALVSRWETGEVKTIDVKDCAVVAAALGVAVEDLTILPQVDGESPPAAFRGVHKA